VVKAGLPTGAEDFVANDGGHRGGARSDHGASRIMCSHERRWDGVEDSVLGQNKLLVKEGDSILHVRSKRTS
jgi:hypothetical protein